MFCLTGSVLSMESFYEMFNAKILGKSNISQRHYTLIDPEQLRNIDTVEMNIHRLLISIDALPGVNDATCIFLSLSIPPFPCNGNCRSNKQIVCSSCKCFQAIQYRLQIKPTGRQSH